MKRFILFYVLMAMLSCTQVQSTSDVMELFDPETLTAEQVESESSDVKIIESQGIKSINVKSKDTFEAQVIIKSDKEHPWNLSDSYQVMAEVSNTGELRAQVAMYVGLDPDPLMRWYCSNIVDLEPGERKTVYVDLTWLPWVHKTQLDLKGMRGVPGNEKTDRSLVQQISLSAVKPTTKQEFTVHRLYAQGTTEVRDTTGFMPFVDKYGQYKHDEWSDKVHNDEELKAISAREEQDLLRYPQAPEVDKYGGWTGAPKQEATGYFRTQKVGDKWWLVDPEGNLFWSAGVNCVSFNTATTIKDREEYFEGIPQYEGDDKQFFGRDGDSFNHYSKNLQRIYGDSYVEKYRDLTHQRFASWGINTIGFVSDKELSSQHKTPYVGSVWIRGTRKIDASEGYWGQFHDVFDPNFQKIVRECVESQKFGANDPWCIGYYIDNELSWGTAGSLSVAALKSPADQPAKIAFISDLKAKYRNIAALNKVWGSTYASWNAMLESTDAPDEIKAEEDLNLFYDKLTNKYFKTIHDELERVAPHQLYMGCRLAWAQNDYTMHAAAKYCDIISFNKYEHTVEYLGLPEGVDCPIIIGEFHFGALDRGMFHRGVKWAESQEERGEMYQSYIQSALRNNYIIGAHWFQYLDESLTGRGDGENYNVGLVNTANLAYPELIDKIRETCYDKYNYRYNHK